MKLTMMALMFLCVTAQAQVPSMSKMTDKAKTVGMDKVTAMSKDCKEEKMKYCKDKTLDALKACLIDNKANLSDLCKRAVGL